MDDSDSDAFELGSESEHDEEIIGDLDSSDDDFIVKEEEGKQQEQQQTSRKGKRRRKEEENQHGRGFQTADNSAELETISGRNQKGE